VSSPATSAVPVPAFTAQPLVWRSCDVIFQCSTMTVPLDYANPSGSKIGIAVIRLRSTSKNRIGSVVLNPGGPGGSGITYELSVAKVVQQELNDRFDVVSFDPRGVGASDPIRCLTTAQEDAYVGFLANPADPAQVAEQASLAKEFASACEARNGPLLAHVGTVNTARDLDVLRGAIGDSKLTYIGASYGTYLGAIYASMFPTHVRALVLDGAVDPSASMTTVDHRQAQGFELALHSYIASCVSSSACPLGRSAATAEGKLDALLSSLDAKPLPGQGSRTVNKAIGLNAVALAMYSPTLWPSLTAALQSAFAGKGSRLLALSDEEAERTSSGYTNLIDSNVAINCADRPGPSGGIAGYAAAAASGVVDGPTFGVAIGWALPPCAYWPVPPESTPAPVSKLPGLPTVLVVGTIRDPATPYAQAVSLSSQLQGRLLTYNGDGHTAYLRGSACIDRAVNAYVLAGALPASGLVCQPG
jgi:pimeloyl-ACP methyl ester carboxylesterase